METPRVWDRSPDDGEFTWASTAERLRRLQRLHAWVLVAFCAGMLAIAATFGVVDGARARGEQRREAAVTKAISSIQDLHRLHTDVRSSGRISGDDLAALRTVRSFLNDAPDRGGVTQAAAAQEDVVAALDQLITMGEGAGNLTLPLYTERVFAGLEEAQARWFEALEREQAAAMSAGRTLHGRMLVLAGAAIVLLGIAGAAVSRGVRRTGNRLVDELQRRTAEQSAMHAIARAAAQGADVSALSQVIGAQLAAPLGADDVTVATGDLAVAHLEMAATDTLEADGTALTWPVMVGEERVGAITAWWTDHARPSGATECMNRLAHGLGLAVESARAREHLEMQAASDPLTRLANHRVFHDALAGRFAAAVAEGRPFALAVIDIDHLRDLNDSFGHGGGDAVLVEVARRLRALAGPDDLVARVSGERFAWIMVDRNREAATAHAEHARRWLTDRPVDPVGEVTVSVGVATDTDAGGPAELTRCTDIALRAAKDGGRNTVRTYQPGMASDNRDAESRAKLVHLREFAALQALARAVDLRDQNTQRHSERVAAYSYLIAIELGWDADRAARLRQAALVHDVGKVGVPDAVLLKPGRLTDDERLIIETHSSLGAQIVSEVLDPEQVSWVRGHHERIDGAGYPDGLTGPHIPDGARLMAVADTWDAMTSDRPYRAGMETGRALAICREVSGSQLCTRGVNALAVLLERGDLRAAADAA